MHQPGKLRYSLVLLGRNTTADLDRYQSKHALTRRFLQHSQMLHRRLHVRKAGSHRGSGDHWLPPGDLPVILAASKSGGLNGIGRSDRTAGHASDIPRHVMHMSMDTSHCVIAIN